MTNEYDYWMYYIIKNELNQEIAPELYAYTDKKSDAHSFEELRNMKLFKRVKHKLQKQEVNQLASDYPSEFLCSNHILFYDRARLTGIKVPMIMTVNEKITVMNKSAQLMTEEIYNYCWTDPTIFCDDLKDALKVLGYNKLFRTVARGNNINGENEDIVNLVPDELGIFLHYFGFTMKK